MSDIAIQAHNLSKRYRIGLKEELPETLAGALSAWLKSPLSNFRRVRNLSHFGQSSGEADDIIWALNDVSFDIMCGEVVGIIGRNGAGKSTLLKILSRITEPTSGRAILNGRVSSLLEVGTGFHSELTGRENVYLNGTILGMTREQIDRKFDEIVDFSGVEKYIDTPVKRYSSGMKVRLAFAVAAHLDPEVLIIDEVLAVGDAGFRKKCLGKIEQVARQGRTILLVSHNMLSIQSLCSRAILLEEGRIVFNGATEIAVNKYLSSTEIVHNQSILERADRNNGETFRFASVDFLNPDTMKPWHTLIAGQPVIVRIGYENYSNTSIEDVGLSITFFTMMRGHLFGCKNRAVGTSLDVRPGAGYSDCYLPKWPLKAGQYTYDLTAEVNDNELDWLGNAGLLDTEHGDYYGTGIVPSADRPGVLIDYLWSPFLHGNEIETERSQFRGYADGMNGTHPVGYRHQHD